MLEEAALRAETFMVGWFVVFSWWWMLWVVVADLKIMNHIHVMNVHKVPMSRTIQNDGQDAIPRHIPNLLYLPYILMVAYSTSFYTVYLV